MKKYFSLLFFAALVACSSQAATLPTTAQDNLQSTKTSSATFDKVGTVVSKISSTEYGYLFNQSCGHLHVYVNSSTVYSPTGYVPAINDVDEVIGTGSCATSVTASAIKHQVASPSPSPTASPSPTPLPSATPSSTIWQIGDCYVLPSQSDGQYQTPIFINNGTGVDFQLVRNYNGTDNYRDQLNPTYAPDCSNTTNSLADGSVYDWKFQTVDNLGQDVNYSQNLIWQIHDTVCSCSPVTVLGVQNINDGGNVWYFSISGHTWKGSYVVGATDNWEIQAKISTGSTGYAKLYRNSALVADFTGATYTSNTNGNPWWNFGIYEWDWKAGHPAGQVSNLTYQDIIFNSMVETKI